MSESNIKEWSPETGELITVIKPPSHLKQSSFRDEQDPNVYHLEIPVQGGQVYAREMDDALHGEYLERQKKFKETMERPMQIEVEAQRLDAQNKLSEAMALRFSAQKSVEEARLDNKEFTRKMLTQTLAGWSFARPFSVKAFGQLRGDDQQTVITQIIRASSVNRDELDFLAVDSTES